MIRTPLPSDDIFSIVRHKNLAALKQAIAQGIDVNSKDENGYSLLSIAVTQGAIGKVYALLQQGADPNLCNGSEKWNSWHYAACGTVPAILRALLTHALVKERKVNMQTNRGYTPLHLVARSLQKENLSLEKARTIIKLLILWQTNDTLLDKKDKTAGAYSDAFITLTKEITLSIETRAQNMAFFKKEKGTQVTDYVKCQEWLTMDVNTKIKHYLLQNASRKLPLEICFEIRSYLSLKAPHISYHCFPVIKLDSDLEQKKNDRLRSLSNSIG